MLKRHKTAIAVRMHEHGAISVLKTKLSNHLAEIYFKHR